MAQPPAGPPGGLTHQGSDHRVYTAAEVASLRRELQNRDRQLLEQEAVMAAVLQSTHAAQPAPAPRPVNEWGRGGAAVRLSTEASPAPQQQGLLVRLGGMLNPHSNPTTTTAPLYDEGHSIDKRSSSVTSLPDAPLMVGGASSEARSFPPVSVGGAGTPGVWTPTPPPGRNKPMTDEELARSLQEEETRRATRGADQQRVRPAQDFTRGGGEALPVAPYAAGSGRWGGASPSASARNMTDAQYAATLQQMELYSAAQNAGTRDTAEEADSNAIEDPVWGRYEGRAGGKPYRPHEVLCLSMCPCFIPPYCNAERKKAYSRVGKSAALWLSVIQIVLLFVSLGWRGFAPMAVNPMVGPWPDTLDLMQAKNAAELKYRFEFWRLVTPIFLHAGVIHLLMNLLMQLRLGLYLEMQWGTPAFLQIYLASGTFACAFSSLLVPDEIGVGASGALMGVMGAWIVHLIIHWSDGDAQEIQQRAFQFVIAIVNVSVIIGFSFVPYIDWAAHIFGLIGGMLIGCWVFCRPSENPNNIGSRKVVRIVGLTLFLGILGAALAGVFTSINPSTALLDYCNQILLPSYPNMGLRCYG